MAEWSKAPDSSSGLRKRAWVQIPLLTFLLNINFAFECYYGMEVCNYVSVSVLQLLSSSMTPHFITIRQLDLR
ncbi:hypothetical protein BRARA_A01556 [Brassica rapa]|uniref:Uncharacterized protein n=1 Tax=Brassica campestris TaxID=3711 RepID=A0A398ATT5_BRACM|nr:hypothetical protein BRARA_A01556 [Brassica rapa]